MGTWASGNFDSDTAADHLSGIAGKLIADVTKAMGGDPVELEADEYWGTAVPCNIELLALLAEQRWVGAMVPDAATVAAWKAKYLKIWESSIDALEPSPEWKAQRRAAIVATFDRLTAASARKAGGAAPTKKKALPQKKAPPRKKVTRGR
jgi:hypothetical protein